MEWPSKRFNAAFRSPEPPSNIFDGHLVFPEPPSNIFDGHPAFPEPLSNIFDGHLVFPGPPSNIFDGHPAFPEPPSNIFDAHYGVLTGPSEALRAQGLADSPTGSSTAPECASTQGGREPAGPGPRPDPARHPALRLRPFSAAWMRPHRELPDNKKTHGRSRGSLNLANGGGEIRSISAGCRG